MVRFDPKPVCLESPRVKLVPLSVEHAAGLFEAGRDEAIWKHLPRGVFSSSDDAATWIDAALADMQTGRRMPFTIIDCRSGRIAGSTSYLDIQRDHRTLEIGWTWLGAPFQRSCVNTECKFLLLGHAFDVLHAMRVQFKTDRRNERSRRAVERIGGTFEGILRNHMLLPDGTIRDSAYYSIIKEDWVAGVKDHLQGLLLRSRAVPSGTQHRVRDDPVA